MDKNQIIKALTTDKKYWEDFIVEVAAKENGRTVLSMYGKIFVPKTLHLSNQQLEQIHTLGNYGPENIEPIYIERDSIVDETPYFGIPIYSISDDMFFVCQKREYDCVNDELFIHKHHIKSIDEDKGYMLDSNHRRGDENWVFVPRKQALDYFSNHPYIREIK